MHEPSEFNPQTAGQKLAPIISVSWFAQELLPKLAFRPMEEKKPSTILRMLQRAARI